MFGRLARECPSRRARHTCAISALAGLQLTSCELHRTVCLCGSYNCRRNQAATLLTWTPVCSLPGVGGIRLVTVIGSGFLHEARTAVNAWKKASIPLPNVVVPDVCVSGPQTDLVETLASVRYACVPAARTPIVREWSNRTCFGLWSQPGSVSVPRQYALAPLYTCEPAGRPICVWLRGSDSLGLSASQWFSRQVAATRC